MFHSRMPTFQRRLTQMIRFPPGENGLRVAVSPIHGGSLGIYRYTPATHSFFVVPSSAQRHTAASTTFGRHFGISLQDSSQIGTVSCLIHPHHAGDSHRLCTLGPVHPQRRHHLRFPAPHLQSLIMCHRCWPCLPLRSSAENCPHSSTETQKIW